MTCNNCDQEHEITKWKLDDPDTTWCEKCLPFGSEDVNVQYVMIDGEP